MNIVIALLLTIISFTFIAYPLFRRKKVSPETTDCERYRELSARLDTTFAMQKDLEFDFQSGILSEEEYNNLKEEYRRKAMTLLEDADSLESDSEMGEKIEEQVQVLRQSIREESSSIKHRRKT
ncbi:c-type cytochrome biogenesis protein CcmI [Chloroflexota bacterium]